MVQAVGSGLEAPGGSALFGGAGLHAGSDFLIGVSFLVIAGTLALFMRRARGEAPFRRILVAFCVFLALGGATHLLEGLGVWLPLALAITVGKVLTAAAAVIAAALLPPLVPLVLGTLKAAHLSDSRRRDLETAHGELRGFYLRLQELDRLRSQFFANVSHELRTPLTLILGPVDGMRSADNLTPEQRRDLDVVRRNAQLLREHLDDLLDVAMRESGELHNRYVRVDVARLIRNAAKGFETRAAERSIHLDLRTPKRLVAEVDPDKLQRVALNLIGNAFKFTPPGGSVRVELVEEGDKDARLEVGDSGPGIPPGEREGVFERFRRLETALEDTQGTGLGLSIARDFARLHGGDVTVDTAPEGGALFIARFRLQAHEGAKVRSGEAGEGFFGASNQDGAEPDASDRTSGQNGTGPRVLVVEDNRAVNRFLATTLEEGLQVETAFDGEEALRKAVASPPDLVLTDLMMPVMAGDELVERMRAHARLKHVPVIVLTAREDHDLKIELLRKGVQDYLTKPFSAEELRARVFNQVRAKRARDVLNRSLQTQETDLERLAEEISGAQQELMRALDEARVARQIAERASRVKTNFLRLMSHELRTPLTAMRLQLTLLRRNKKAPLTESQAEALERMARSLERQAEIIDTILEYARIDSGRYELRPTRFSLYELARTVVSDFQPVAAEKGIELRHAGEEGGPIESDPELMRLVIANLVGNAVKFTQEGFVNVAVDGQGPTRRVVVSDTGPGIPASFQASIFEPFQQLEDVRYTQEPGSGLGLALVKELVGALGGDVRLESEEGQGARFEITLPDQASAEPPSAAPDW